MAHRDATPCSHPTPSTPFTRVAIQVGDSDRVRTLLLGDKSLAAQKGKLDGINFDPAVEMEAYKFLGAYLGALTPLHVALLKGADAIARDIIDRTLAADLDTPFGGGNTALHLATLLGAKDLVRVLLERGASPGVKNNKGFSPVDLCDDEAMARWFTSGS
jgi:hypothetical protein